MIRAVLLAACLSPIFAADRVLLLSLDGLGYKILSTDPATRDLKSLHAMARRGTFLPLRTSFPSKTAAGHAAIFTGKWSGGNGVFSNTNPLAPRGEHRFDESVTGFRSDSLTAEPIWTTAARRGVRTVAYQVTQAYPFTALSAGVDLPHPPVVVNGYQTKLIAPHRVARLADLARQPDGAYEWREGALRFRVERLKGEAVRVSWGSRSVVARKKGGFSPILPVENSGAYFRLFESSAHDLVLYRTSIHEPGVSGLDAATLLKATGAFIGNTPTALYRTGALGPTLFQGGDGTAERRYLECFELVTRQMTRQMLWLDEQQRPKLFVGYYPQPDDLEHLFYGLSRTGHPEFDAIRRQAYAILDRGLRPLLRRFAHVVVTSDHGMAPATHHIHMGALLTELGWPPERARANASCIFLNTADWRGGVVALTDAPAERERLAAALARHPLITRVYRYEELAAFGLAGERRPDACFDVVPLHYPDESDQGPVVTPYASPEGEHGFDPALEEMQAILVTTRRAVKASAVVEVAGLALALVAGR